ncbi:diguanylate cyclase [Rhodobacterales bacterium HKCCE3408]|nr:diguanylate cyclase [Rhodobacterales bacterium HKCCE3408]
MIIVAASTIAAAFAVVILKYFSQVADRRSAMAPAAHLGAARTYRFRDGYLVSDPDPDDAFLDASADRAGALSDLCDALARIDARVPAAMDGLCLAGKSFLLIGHAGPDALTIAGQAEGADLVVKVSGAHSGNGRILIDAESFRSQRAETEALKELADGAPIVAWREAEDRTITWANAGYLRNLERIIGPDEDIVWPLRPLFGPELYPLPDPGQTRRCSIRRPDRARPAWFDISAMPVGTETLIFAQPADRIVAAEEALRDFVQTLSKTFADLPIGLAIFDKHRELVLFNPALITLSTIDAQFLSSRPTLFSFLDQLREKRQMPEPKNYKAWRESIARLEADAADGSYHDLWTLPTGQTYRVIGRPHPGGALAFMFEDISSEVSLTRQFRADLDLYQAVIDQDRAAVAVFSNQAQLVLSNAAYAALWGHDPREMLGNLSLSEATQRWERAMVPAPVWGDIRDFAEQRDDREAWTDEIRIPGRGKLELSVAPLKGGATILRFSLRSAGGERAQAGAAVAAQIP